MTFMFITNSLQISSIISGSKQPYKRFVKDKQLLLLIIRSENNAFKLWIPDNSDFVENNDWLETNAPMDAR